MESPAKLLNLACQPGKHQRRPQGFSRVILRDSTYANLSSELEKRILETPGVFLILSACMSVSRATRAEEALIREAHGVTRPYLILAYSGSETPASIASRNVQLPFTAMSSTVVSTVIVTCCEADACRPSPNSTPNNKQSPKTKQPLIIQHTFSCIS
jgi:hypothetical protein